MARIELFSDIIIDKDPEIIKDFINLYWKIFINKNKKGKELIFVKRSEIIHSSKLSRRNCYKHLRHLLLKGIFIEEESHIVPSALILRVNKKIINPSEIIFGIKIDKSIINRGIVNIKPEISEIKIRELTKLIICGKSRLYDFISIPFDIGENLSFSSSFSLGSIPKFKRVIGLWKQKDKIIAEKEKRLYKILNPHKDPFGHNSIMEFRREDSSPLFEIEKNKKRYIIAGWAAKYVYEKNNSIIIGDYGDKENTGSKLFFYDENKNLIGQMNFVLPSCKKGIPLGDMSPLIFTRGNYNKFIKNKNYIGYYDFKNDGIEVKYRLNHLIIHFSKFDIPKKTRFLKICAGKESILNIINIFPYDKLDIKFIKKRMANLGKRKFIQDNLYPLPFLNIESINLYKFKKINKLLNKASLISGKKKQILLEKALEQLIDYSYYFKKKAYELVKKGKEISNLVKMSYTITRGLRHISTCIKKCPTKLKEKLFLSLNDNEKFYNKMIPLLVKKAEQQDLDIFFECKYENFFRLMRSGYYYSLDKKLDELKYDLKLMDEPFNKFKTMREFIIGLKRKIEKDFFSLNTRKYLKKIILFNNERSKICMGLASRTRKFKGKKGYDSTYIANKSNFYDAFSLYYLYQNLLYKAKYYKKIAIDKDKFEELSLMLEQFKDKIF